MATSNPLVGGVVESVEISKINPPRIMLREEAGDLDGLASSILQKGLLHPIVVRLTPDGYELIAGWRRLQACRMLKIRHIPCHILELDDRQAFEASLIENIQHSTLTSLEEAKGFQKYSEQYGYGGVNFLAKKIGKSPTYVSRRISLLSLDSQTRDKLLRRRNYPAGVVQELISLDEDSRKELVDYMVDEKVTRSEVRKFIKGRREKLNIQSADFLQISTEKRRHDTSVERVFAQTIISLKICMGRIDAVLNHLGEEDWFARDVLSRERSFIHERVDVLLRLQKKVKHMPRTVWGGEV